MVFNFCCIKDLIFILFSFERLKFILIKLIGEWEEKGSGKERILVWYFFIVKRY